LAQWVVKADYRDNPQSLQASKLWVGGRGNMNPDNILTAADKESYDQSTVDQVPTISQEE